MKTGPTLMVSSPGSRTQSVIVAMTHLQGEADQRVGSAYYLSQRGHAISAHSPPACCIHVVVFAYLDIRGTSFASGRWSGANGP